VTVVGKSTP